MLKLEDFKKLKQNDRIEFMLRSNHLNENKDSLYFNWSSILFILSVFIGFITLLSMQFFIMGNYDAQISLLKIIEPFFKMAIIIIFFGVLWNLAWSIKFSKYKKELKEEFFKTETKPRR
ncbi:hypothetical protein LCGC14_1954810 [marine sediment metagenome]|uniref:Uncharacterized protein n=1 Tax=marine sediment metagenome TaxID=412755 RepID=A0A0F9FGM8_9ZZZZ